MPLAPKTIQSTKIKKPLPPKEKNWEHAAHPYGETAMVPPVERDEELDKST